MQGELSNFALWLMKNINLKMMYDDICVAANDVFFFFRIAVYKAVYPTVGTIADVIAAIDHVSFTFKYLKLMKKEECLKNNN